MFFGYGYTNYKSSLFFFFTQAMQSHFIVNFLKDQYKLFQDCTNLLLKFYQALIWTAAALVLTAVKYLLHLVRFEHSIPDAT